MRNEIKTFCVSEEYARYRAEMRSNEVFSFV